MKLQKIIATNENNELGLIIENILKKQKEIVVLEDSRKLKEQELINYLIGSFKNDESYIFVEKILNIELYAEHEKLGCMLFNICRQIAESIAKYYRKEQTALNSSINYGIEYYDIPFEEMEKAIIMINKTSGKDDFRRLNIFLKDYGVKVGIRSCDLRTYKSKRRLCIEIFIDK